MVAPSPPGSGPAAAPAHASGDLPVPSPLVAAPAASDHSRGHMSAADASHDAELIDVQQRLRWAIVFTAPLFALAMGGMLGAFEAALASPVAHWLQLALATPVVLWCGWPLLQRGWCSLRTRHFDMFTLIGLAVAVAYGFSVLGTVLPQALRGTAPTALHFESAAMIVTLALLGRLLELRARRQAAAALRAPVDDAVLTRLGVVDESTLAQIVQKVADVARNRAAVQALADRVVAWLVPAVIASALLAAVVWILVGPEPRIAFALVAAVSTLIIACPGAIGLATPLSMTVAMGRGVQSGVLFRGGEILERLEFVDTLVLDKTGTLTCGRPEVTEVLPVDGVPESELLRFAASLEQASEHPLGQAIVRHALSRGLRLGRSYGFEAHAGAGAAGVVQLRRVLVGTEALLQSERIDPGSLVFEAAHLRDAGQTVVFVAVEGVPIGLIALADSLKADAWDVVHALQEQGVRVVLVSGDHPASVRAIAGQAGIKEFHGSVDPAGKAEMVQQLRAEARIVAMAGDCSNDAQALAVADVGIAMGAGAGVATQTAGVVLACNDLRGLLRAFQLSAATMRNVRQNLWFAFGCNAVGVPLAAGVLFPWLGLLLPPWLAAAVMTLGSVSVIHNALRLRRVELA